jgi:hypothetical protein
VHGLWGAGMAVRHDGGTLKDALATYRLLVSEHTEGLTVAEAFAIASKAHVYKIDPFDLWMVLDGYHCDDLDHAVLKTLEMKALYDAPPTIGSVN